MEQRAINLQRFGAEAIHSTKNVVNIARDVNQAIANYYSSIRPAFTGTKTVRQWLTNQSFARQFEFGMDILNRVKSGKILP